MCVIGNRINKTCEDGLVVNLGIFQKLNTSIELPTCYTHTFPSIDMVRPFRVSTSQPRLGGLPLPPSTHPAFANRSRAVHPSPSWYGRPPYRFSVGCGLDTRLRHHFNLQSTIVRRFERPTATSTSPTSSGERTSFHFVCTHQIYQYKTHAHNFTEPLLLLCTI